MLTSRFAKLKNSVAVDRIMATLLVVAVVSFLFAMYYSLWNRTFPLALILMVFYIGFNAYNKRKISRNEKVMKFVSFLLLAIAIAAHSWVFIVGILLVSVLLSARNEKLSTKTASDNR